MNKILLLILLLTPFGLYSQNNWEKADVGDGSGNRLKGIECYKKTLECEGSSFLALKFVNTTDKEARVRWKDSFLREGKWENSDPKEVTVPKDDEREGSCNSDQGFLLVPFQKGDKEKIIYRLKDLRVRQ